MSKLGYMAKSVAEDRGRGLKELTDAFAEARPKITGEADLLKFDQLSKNVVSGFTTAMDELIAMSPILEKYKIE